MEDIFVSHFISKVWFWTKQNGSNPVLIAFNKQKMVRNFLVAATLFKRVSWKKNMFAKSTTYSRSRYPRLIWFVRLAWKDPFWVCLWLHMQMYFNEILRCFLKKKGIFSFGDRPLSMAKMIGFLWFGASQTQCRRIWIIKRCMDVLLIVLTDLLQLGSKNVWKLKSNLVAKLEFKS